MVPLSGKSVLWRQAPDPPGSHLKERLFGASLSPRQCPQGSALCWQALTTSKNIDVAVVISFPKLKANS
jgi:hypothetical protein